MMLMMMLNVISIFAQETIASIDLDVMKKMRSDKYVYLSSSSPRTTRDFWFVDKYHNIDGVILNKAEEIKKEYEEFEIYEFSYK